MIIFATCYDSPTCANYSIAVELKCDDCTKLFIKKATQDNLLTELSSCRTKPLFAMGHGKPNKLNDQNRQPAMSDNDVAWFTHRLSFIFACHTATKLGQSIAKAGGIWWGYTGAIDAPPSDSIYLRVFLPIFQYIIANFPRSSSNERSCQIFLEELKTICDNANEELDKLQEEGVNVDTEAYLCVLNLWDRLRIWFPGKSIPVRSPDSKSPLIIPEY